MTIEPWADAVLSDDLSRLIEGGEGETVEFKREFPKQARDLAKTMAAFASTKGGHILLGVGDDGAALGVADAKRPTVRDDFSRRVVGVSQMIDPPVRPQISWASAQGVAVLVVAVEKGLEPLYYVEKRAYVRHHATSRPATPSEVIAAVQSTSTVATSESNDQPEFSELANVLSQVRRWSDTDSQMRSLKPWVDEWSADAERYASKLRKLSVTDWAAAHHAEKPLETMADRLDDVARFRHYIGGGGSFDAVSVAAGNAAAALMRDLVEPHAISDENQRQVLHALVQRARELAQMWTRAGIEIFDGRVEKAMEESYVIGKQIAEWSYFKFSVVSENLLVDVRRIGLGLVKLRSSRLYSDGGASLQRVVDTAHRLVSELNARVLDGPDRRAP